jgi:hypothetical protein
MSLVPLAAAPPGPFIFHPCACAVRQPPPCRDAAAGTRAPALHAAPPLPPGDLAAVAGVALGTWSPARISLAARRASRVTGGSAASAAFVFGGAGGDRGCGRGGPGPWCLGGCWELVWNGAATQLQQRGRREREQAGIFSCLPAGRTPASRYSRTRGHCRPLLSRPRSLPQSPTPTSHPRHRQQPSPTTRDSPASTA